MSKIKVGDQVRLSRTFPSNMNHFKGRGKTAVVIEVSGNECGLCFTQGHACRWWYGAHLLTPTGKRFSREQVEKLKNCKQRPLKPSKYDIGPNVESNKTFWDAIYPNRKNPYA